MTSSGSVPYERNALFANIPRERLAEESLIHSEITVAAGEVIFEEGDPPDFCYLVGSGSVDITKQLPGGQVERLATLRPGDFFGELALYDASHRSARAAAAVPTRLARLDAGAFERLRQIAPLQITSTFADRAIERMRVTNDTLIFELAALGWLSRVGTEVGTLAHNLRSPFATIHSAADLLRDMVQGGHYDPAEISRFIGIILGTADRALLQIDQLMARLRGEVEEKHERVPVPELLRDLRTLISGYLRNPAIRYRDDGCTYRGDVVVDRAEMVAALANLVKNAVEALPPEGGGIDVSVATEGRFIVFSVTDTGKGIPAELIPKVFEKKFTYGKKGGTGLGLAHVKALAEKQGGRVQVTSDAGRGTIVQIRVPDATQEDFG